MSDKTRSLRATIALAKARQAILKKYGLDSIGEKTMIDELEKIVEAEEAIELAKANQPQVIQPVKKSWRDNIWTYLIIGIVVGAGGIILGQLILKAIMP